MSNNKKSLLLLGISLFTSIMISPNDLGTSIVWIRAFFVALAIGSYQELTKNKKKQDDDL